MAYLYGYNFYIMPGVVAGIMIFLMPMFTCPLITRNPTELAIIFGPDKAKVLKVAKRLRPFFVLPDTVYWFGKAKPVTVMQPKIKPKTQRKAISPLSLFRKRPKESAAEIARQEHEEMDPAPVPKNNVHVYIQGINQPVDQLERMETKYSDLTAHWKFVKQTKSQGVRFPKISLAFERNWALVVKKDGSELRPTKQPQPQKVNWRTRIGLYVTKDVWDEMQRASSENATITSTSTSTNTTSTESGDLLSVTIQKVTDIVGDVQQNANFSASFARDLLRDIRWMERSFLNKLIGVVDMLPLMIIIGGAVAVIAVLLLYPSGPTVGPRPVG